MSREVRRVPIDFDWPLKKPWEGYLLPERLRGERCPDCRNGYSPAAERLHDLWYGDLPFSPEDTGSTPLTAETPAIRALAERAVERDSEYYGAGERAIAREARRLADYFNSQWSHHLSQDDVDALVAADRLWDLTRTWSRETGWQPIDPPVIPTAAQVNEWSLDGMGHDGFNAAEVIKARCERENLPLLCDTCEGRGAVEAFKGQRAEAEAWKPTKPPTGNGWQLWETVSEGSPISPVFETADDLATWISDPKRGRDWVPGDVARKFVEVGWAPSGADTPETGVVGGVEFVGFVEPNRTAPGGD